MCTQIWRMCEWKWIISPETHTNAIWCDSSVFLTNEKLLFQCCLISCVVSDQFLSSTTFPLRLHLTLFINSFNRINVFGQRFHVASGCHQSCWFLFSCNVDVGVMGYIFHQLGKEKWNANTRLSQDLIIKKSTLSNTISETWDELNLTKCTSGGMVRWYCSNELQSQCFWPPC